MAEVKDNSSILLKIRKSVLHGMQKRKNGIFRLLMLFLF